MKITVGLSIDHMAPINERWIVFDGKEGDESVVFEHCVGHRGAVEPEEFESRVKPLLFLHGVTEIEVKDGGVSMHHFQLNVRDL